MCAIFITLFLSLFNVIDAQVEKKNRLTSIVQSIDQYKGKSVLMIMKLRDVDYVMEKITFYDSDNIDIVFDIAGYVKKPALKKSMRTILPGVNYRVKFIAHDTDPNGLLTGSIEFFWPEFTERLP